MHGRHSINRANIASFLLSPALKYNGKYLDLKSPSIPCYINGITHYLDSQAILFTCGVAATCAVAEAWLKPEQQSLLLVKVSKLSLKMTQGLLLRVYTSGHFLWGLLGCPANTAVFPKAPLPTLATLAPPWVTLPISLLVLHFLLLLHWEERPRSAGSSSCLTFPFSAEQRVTDSWHLGQGLGGCFPWGSPSDLTPHMTHCAPENLSVYPPTFHSWGLPEGLWKRSM